MLGALAQQLGQDICPREGLHQLPPFQNYDLLTFTLDPNLELHYSVPLVHCPQHGE